MIHLYLLSTPSSADKILFHAIITSAVTNIEPADNTMLPSFSDNSSARQKADSTGLNASDSSPACSACSTIFSGSRARGWAARGGGRGLIFGFFYRYIP